MVVIVVIIKFFILKILYFSIHLFIFEDNLLIIK